MPRLKRLIDSKIQDCELSSVSLADEFGISAHHLNRKVRELTGSNTTKLIRSRRIAKACNLLRETDLRISEIYMKCGIDSANYFSRVFKDHTGFSPTEYRTRLSKK